jgi:hypothetical protein
MSASGVGSTRRLDGAADWGSWLGGAFVSWAVASPFALTARLDALVPLARPTFAIAAPGGDIPVHRPASVGFRAGLGIEVRFL